MYFLHGESREGVFEIVMTKFLYLKFPTYLFEVLVVTDVKVSEVNPSEGCCLLQRLQREAASLQLSKSCSSKRTVSLIGLLLFSLIFAASHQIQATESKQSNVHNQ